MSRIGFLGAGQMGSVIAENLLAKGHELVVFNRTVSKTRFLVSQGARLANTPAEAALDAEMVFSVVGDDAASRSVWEGPDGALAAVGKGCVLVESSTLSLTRIRELALRARARDCRLCDAPIAGSVEMARRREVVILAGGEDPGVACLAEVLSGVVREVLHVGPVGAGTMLKLARSILLGAEIVALSEVLSLARESGLNMDITARAIVDGPTSSAVISSSIQPMLDGGEPLRFGLSLLLKDLGAAMLEAQHLGLELPVGRAVESVLGHAERAGLGSADMTSVINVVGKNRIETGGDSHG